MSGERPAPDRPRAELPPGWPPPNRYGERAVAIANDRRGVVRRSVESLADLPVDLPRAALVGGLAVMVRLYEAHRATTDFDEVTEGRETTIDLLLARGAVRTTNGVLLPDFGVQLDLLDAGMSLTDLGALMPAAGELIATDDERRAVQLALVCRYALETAIPTKILVLEGEEIVAQATIPVALAGSLVAMKAHAAVQDDRNKDKAAGDIYDTFRLIRSWGPSVIAEDLSRAPVAMLATTAAQLHELYVEGAERSARRLRSASMPGVESVSIEDLESVGVAVDALDVFRHWD